MGVEIWLDFDGSDCLQGGINKDSRLYTTATWCLGAVLIGPNKGVGMWLDFDGPDCLQHGTNEE